MSARMRHTISFGMVLLTSAGGSACSRMSRAPDPELFGRLIVGGGALLVVLGTLYYCVRLLRQPGEDDRQHVKRRILRDRW